MLEFILSVSLRKKNLLRLMALMMSGFFFFSLAVLSPISEIDELSDLSNYSTFWNSLHIVSLDEIKFRYEIGFVLLCKLLQPFLSFSAFLYLVQFSIFCAAFLLASQYSRGIFLAIAVSIICVFFYLPIESMATLVIRQGIATSIFFVFLLRCHGGNAPLRHTLPWVVLMMLFHYSSAFILIALILLKISSKMRAFYIWLLAMLLYCADISGKIGLFFYDALGLSLASLNALSIGFEYEVGFKINFLALSLFYVIVPIFFSSLGVIKISTKKMLSDDMFRLYLSLNSLATVFSLMPFYDRFFLWSWALGPFLLLAVFSFRQKASIKFAEAKIMCPT